MNVAELKKELQKIVLQTVPDRLWITIKNNKSLYSEVIQYTKFLSNDSKITERVYCIINNIYKPVKCSVCNTWFVKFARFSSWYEKYCCSSCRKEGVKLSCKEHFENETEEKRLERLNNYNKSIKEKYGVENISQSDIIKQNKIQNSIEKYWVEHFSKTDEFKKNKKKKEFEKFDWKYFLQTDEAKNKIKKTMIKNHWVDSIFKKEWFQEEQKKRNLETIGTTSYLNLKENRDKCIEKLKTKEIIEKRKNTNLIKYNATSPSWNKDVIAKLKESNLKKTWFEWVSQRPEVKEKIKKTKETQSINLIQESISLFNIPIKFIDLDINTRDRTCFCETCNNNFTISKDLFNKRLFKLKNNLLTSDKICTICNNPESFCSSFKEKEIVNFIKSFYKGSIDENTRKIISPKEIDIYLPEINLWIEFDWLYWHSETKWEKLKFFHLEKTNMCKDKGIRLIHIFEDEFDYKKEIVFNRLKHIILKLLSDKGLMNLFKEERFETKIYWRNCTIKEISNNEKNNFLEQYHIQGSDISKYKLGLFYKDELVSVMTFSSLNISKGWIKKDKTYELNRFATKFGFIVIWWASKLLNYFIKKEKPLNIISYSDKRWNTWNVYINLGFKYDSETTCNYWYIKDDYRVHRYNYNKRNLLKLYPEYKEKINKETNKIYTEFEITDELWIDRIWDCGNNKYILNIM